MPLPYSILPPERWGKMGIHSGVLLSEYDPATRTVRREAILGATDGPVTFSARAVPADLGAGVAPGPVMQLMGPARWDVRLSGTLITADTDATRRLLALADADDGVVTPRLMPDIAADFDDLWFVIDYGVNHAADNPGGYVIHMRNALSTGGLRVVARPGRRTRWPFEFSACFSLDRPREVPVEVVVQGE